MPAPLRVFLVEDMARVQSVVIELLGAVCHFAVAGTASTEAEANLWLQDNRGGWDLAIIDLVLDQGSGMSVIRQCRRTSPDAKVLVFSEYVTDGMRQHCADLGADAAIPKSDLEGFIKYCADLSAGMDDGGSKLV